MKKALLILPVCAALTLTGCSNMSKEQQTTLSGGAIGAAAGAAITAIVTHHQAMKQQLQEAAAGTRQLTVVGACWLVMVFAWCWDRQECGRRC